MNTSPSLSPSGTVLVLGGRGRLGLAAVQAFARGGWRVLAQMRPGAQAPQVTGVQWLPLPLDTPGAVQTLVDQVRQAGGATVVVHALNPKQYTRPAWERERGRAPQDRREDHAQDQPGQGGGDDEGSGSRGGNREVLITHRPCPWR